MLGLSLESRHLLRELGRIELVSFFLLTVFLTQNVKILIQLFFKLDPSHLKLLSLHQQCIGREYMNTVHTCPSLRPNETRILSIPFGPRVVFTRSPTAIAPTKLDSRAVSAFSSSASCLRTRTGFREVYNKSETKTATFMIKKPTNKVKLKGKKVKKYEVLTMFKR